MVSAPARRELVRHIVDKGLSERRSLAIVGSAALPRKCAAGLRAAGGDVACFIEYDARFWGREVWSQSLVATSIAFLASYVGLLLSFYADLPSGPAIILTAAFFWLVSLALGTRDSVRTRYLVHSHIHEAGAARSG